MRPDKLFALFAGVTRLAGVGPAAKKALGRLIHGDETAPVIVRDVVFHLPVSVVDRRNSPKLSQAKEGDIVTVIVTVESHHPPPKKRGARLPYKVICNTDDAYLTLVFFHAHGDYIEKSLPQGQKRVVSGKFEKYDYSAQMTHPDIIAPVEDFAKIQTLEPVYALTAGMGNRQLNKIIQSGLKTVPELAEWTEEHYLKQQGWRNWKTSLFAAHQPQVLDDISPLSMARTRLAYDELLANQLGLALVRRGLRKKHSAGISPAGALRAKAIASLPYKLTQGQQKVLSEIDTDMASGERMLRLLQGDVGSGKTVVALLAMLSAIECGRQAALMAPTELLARQHFASISKLLTPLGIMPTLLTGSLKGREYQEAAAAVESGQAKLVIGTHALFQEKIIFKDLGLAVIDEQHRFGVAQRMALTAKSKDTHVLVMTATPIPRTLTMTAFGDMDCSVLAEKPVGRLEIATKAVPLSRDEEILEGLKRAVAKGEKIYWICPLVEESDDDVMRTDLAAVEARYIEFKERFAGRVAMVHGRMKTEERDRVMTGFAGKEFDVLVATTVIEVGVDVPDATIIVIEHAERFGLAQLHQLRGRVGRSDKPSTCILLYTDKCGDIAKSRLRIIRETNDGFRIAEEDLRLRGSGDILGTRQSGLPEFRFANLALHYDLLKAAHDDARLALHRDATLSSVRGQALRCLLYLFGYDENIRFLEAG